MKITNISPQIFPSNHSLQQTTQWRNYSRVKLTQTKHPQLLNDNEWWSKKYKFPSQTWVLFSLILRVPFHWLQTVMFADWDMESYAKAHDSQIVKTQKPRDVRTYSDVIKLVRFLISLKARLFVTCAYY